MEGEAEKDADTLGHGDGETGEARHGAERDGEDRRASHAAASSGSDTDDEGGVEGQHGPRESTLQKGEAAGDNKAASFARAVAKIMESAGGGARGILSVRRGGLIIFIAPYVLYVINEYI